MTRISVIICVYNGGELFKKNIESVSRLKIPDDSWVEFLFVDNNATDGSGELIRNYARRYPDTFYCLFEPKPGKTHALNLGIEKAKGEIIAFTDSDVVLPEDWLVRVREGFEEHDCAGLGGRVLPIWTENPPAWFTDEKDREKRYAILALCGREESEYYPLKEGPLYPTGCNSAVKKKVFLKYGNYRTDLGVWPGLRLGGEDLEFFRRISEAGEKLYYHPRMTAYHQISKNRLEKKYFRKISFSYLFGSLYMHPPCPNRKGEAFRKLISLPENLLKFIVSGFNEKLTVRGNLHYRTMLKITFCELGYRLFGQKKTVRLARALGFIAKI
ncbi:MAG: glycosyltransferase [Candidatus Omnitrophota bacterium]